MIEKIIITIINGLRASFYNRKISSKENKIILEEYTKRGEAGLWFIDIMGKEKQLYVSNKCDLKERILDWKLFFELAKENKKDVEEIKDLSIFILPLSVVYEKFLKKFFKDIKLTKKINDSIFKSLGKNNLEEYKQFLEGKNFSKNEIDIIITKLKEITDKKNIFRNIFIHGTERITNFNELENVSHSVLCDIKNLLDFFIDKGLIEKEYNRKNAEYQIRKLSNLTRKEKDEVERCIGVISKKNHLNWEDLLGNSKKQIHVKFRSELVFRLKKEVGLSFEKIAIIIGNRREVSIKKLFEDHEKKLFDEAGPKSH